MRVAGVTGAIASAGDPSGLHQCSLSVASARGAILAVVSEYICSRCNDFLCSPTHPKRMIQSKRRESNSLAIFASSGKIVTVKGKICDKFARRVL